ncbi:MAG TPA: TolC family protein [Verrucomicrobiae bacterium]|jgi:outer membrane protein TolC
MKHSTFNIQHRTSNLRRLPFVNLIRRWALNVECWIFSAVLILAAGCATFHPQPVSPEKTAADFDVRSLADEQLRAFLETNHVAGNWPRDSWDLSALTLAALYYQPALAEARAQWAAVEATKITAGERPNPTVGFTPTYDTTTPPPWILGLTWDIPIETAGKRVKRIAQAEHLSEAAKWDFVGTAWKTRSNVRAALLALYTARETESLLARQEAAQSNVLRLLEGQLAAGAVSSYEVTQARVALTTTRLARLDATSQSTQARVQLAGALGLPLRALDGVQFSFAGLDQFPQNLTAPEVRRGAILNRADVRGALADYAASQSALQLEIAKQYPDLHLGPGYELDQTDNKWSLGVSLDLPILNHNQGPVAEAMANRAAAAAHFLTVQTTAITEIDSALAGYDAALKKSATVKMLLDDMRKQLDSVQAQAQAGAVEPLTLANAEAEYATGAQSQLNALVKAQEALGQLEDAVQSPLTLAPDTIRAAEKNSPETTNHPTK